MPRKLRPDEIAAIVDELRKRLEARGTVRSKAEGRSDESTAYHTMMVTSDAEDELLVTLVLNS